MLLDLRHLGRNLRRHPTSAVAAALVLALTLGVGASIHAVVDAVLLTPPPFADPEALVIVGESPIDEPMGSRRPVAYGTFERWRERAGTIATLEAFDGTTLTLTGLGPAERVSVVDATPALLTLLGVAPALGRTFAANDVGRPVVIVSHAFWQAKLKGAPDVIGQSVLLGNQPHTIVGVFPERFLFAIDRSEMWRALPVTAAEGTRSGYRVRVVARLAAGVSAAMLTDRLSEVSRQAVPPARVMATPLATAIAGGSIGTLSLLAGAASVAILIAFFNLSGLLLVRSLDRRRELAVRAALGAGASEPARQLSLEAFVLVGAGFAGGVWLAALMTPLIGRLALEFTGLGGQDVSVGWRTVAGMAMLAVVGAGVCGVLPAAVAARWTAPSLLQRSTTDSRHHLRLRRLFVTGEVAVAFVLLIAMTLLGRSLFVALRIDPGFEAAGLLTAQVALPPARYPTLERRASFYRTLQATLQDRLGADAVAVVDELPLTGDRGRSLVGLDRNDAVREAVVRTASPRYFSVMRIPVLAGRPLDARDDASAPPRAVISASLAARLFGVSRAVGRRLWLSAGPHTVEVVGVVGDVKHRALTDPFLPTVYVSGLQAPSGASILVVRSGRSDIDTLAVVRDEVGRMDRDLPVYRPRPMQAVVEASPGVPAARLLTAAFSGFAVLAVVLSVVGLFGIAAHDVSRRRAEIRLRAALGASPIQLLRNFVAPSAALIVGGLAVGGVLSLLVVPALARATFIPVEPDTAGVVLAALVLTAAGTLAVLPATLRAARTAPLTAFRAD
jgi:putative ABC transport system permease protein